MKVRGIIAVALAAGLAVTVPSTGASAQGDAPWTLAAAPDGTFSVETPCDAAQIDAMKAMPADAIPQMNIAPESRVICVQGPLLFLAGVMDAGEIPAGATSLFDTIVKMAEEDKTTEGKPVFTTIGGRRAFVNRDQKDGVVAQTGIIEISRSKAIMLIAGAPEGGVSVAEQAKVIDRFYASLKVAGK